MNRAMKIGIVLLGLTLCSFLAYCTKQADQAGTSGAASSGMTQEQMVARGKYLTLIGGCNDCHTPKVMGPHGPEFDTTRTLSGHPESDPIPEFPAGSLSPTGWMAATNFHLSAWAGPWGISFAANLSPDQTTGSGAWTEESFVGAMKTGKHLGMGREILPPMPWQVIGSVMTPEDLKSIFAYLQSLPPIRNQVPEPVLPPAAPTGDASAH